jgi:hypothetical protein
MAFMHTFLALLPSSTVLHVRVSAWPLIFNQVERRLEDSVDPDPLKTE